MSRINFNAINLAALPQLNDDPIVSRPTPTLRLPTVAHILRASGHNEIVAMTEEHVAAINDAPAVLNSSQINLASAPPYAFPVGRDLAINSQARDTSVRVDFKTK